MPTTPLHDAGPLPAALLTDMQRRVDARVLAGAVMLVADRDGGMRLGATGFADLAARRPLQTDALFWIASITKPITAAAFLMLVDEGRVTLDEPVSRHIPAAAGLRVALPDGSLAAPSHPITIREILSHTAGLRFLNVKDRQIIDSAPLPVSVENALEETLLCDPGSAYNYSNIGIDLAGRILELVSGLPYERFLQERLFAPLGMTETTFAPTPAQLARLATNYTVSPEDRRLLPVPASYLSYPLDRPDRYPAPGGGLFSTAADVARFGLMLANHGALDGKTCLSPEAVRLMTTKQTPAHVTEQYGLGCSSSDDGQAFGHGGALKTSLRVDRGQVRVFMVQHDGDWGGAGENPAELFDAWALRLHPRGAPAAAPRLEGLGVPRN